MNRTSGVTMDQDGCCGKVEVVMKRNHFRTQFSSYATMDLDGGNLDAMTPAGETVGGPTVMVMVMQMNHFPSSPNQGIGPENKLQNFKIFF